MTVLGTQQTMQANAGRYWTGAGRSLVFLLAASSIACLLADFYRLCPMSVFTVSIFLPALAVLSGFALVDSRRGDGQLWRSVCVGALAGLIAAAAYDGFRLPFVFSKQWGLSSWVPQMPLFKVFPGFGAMILGQPVEQAHYSRAAQALGWAYHFSNGATFGVMFVAMVGNPARRHWAWAVVFAVGLELGMLLTPYSQVFKIALTSRFVAVTVAAHSVFGACLGGAARWLTTAFGLR